MDFTYHLSTLPNKFCNFLNLILNLVLKMILFFNDIKDWNDLPAMIKQIRNKTSLKKNQ